MTSKWKATLFENDQQVDETEIDEDDSEFAAELFFGEFGHTRMSEESGVSQHIIMEYMGEEEPAWLDTEGKDKEQYLKRLSDGCTEGLPLCPYGQGGNFICSRFDFEEEGENCTHCLLTGGAGYCEIGVANL